MQHVLPAAWQHALKRTRALLVDGYALDGCDPDAMMQLLRAMGAADAVVAFDPQHVAHDLASGACGIESTRFLRALLPLCHALFVTLDEAQALCGRDAKAAACAGELLRRTSEASASSRIQRVVIVKLGADGCVVAARSARDAGHAPEAEGRQQRRRGYSELMRQLSAAGRLSLARRDTAGSALVWHVRAFEPNADAHDDDDASGIVDTTGAGDAFAAGFLAAWLRGMPPPLAAVIGAAAGCATVQRLGAGRNVATRDEILALLRRQASAAMAEAAEPVCVAAATAATAATSTVPAHRHAARESE